MTISSKPLQPPGRRTRSAARSLFTASTVAAIMISGTAGVVGGVQNPVGFDGNLAGRSPQASVAGNQITYSFGPNLAFPITAYNLVANKPNTSTGSVNPYVIVGSETLKACNDEMYDCTTSMPSWYYSDNLSKEHYPERVDAEGNKTVFDDRLDADRHCMWQGFTTEASNAAFAERLGDAHEADGREDAPVGAEEMDQYNNITGRAVGLVHENDTAGIENVCHGYADKARITADPAQFGTNTNANDLVALNG
ncbi:MAG: DUF6973 domain-containing protein [Rhodococcus sp. (in: high G+C Gram-positive bacteria)]